MNGRSRDVSPKYWRYGKYGWRGIYFTLSSAGSYLNLSTTLKLNFPGSDASQAR